MVIPVGREHGNVHAAFVLGDGLLDLTRLDTPERGRSVPVGRGKEAAVFGEGVTPIDTIMDMLKAADYDGVLAWEPGPQDEAGVEKSVANMLEKMG